MTFYEKTTLPGGLRVITETIPHVRSASVGVWVGAGSCWEEPANAGISHLIEHLLFKGTERRSARQIAREIDGRGGNLNAFTSKENTCFYAKVLDEHLPIAVDVLADMLQHSRFDEGDIAKEKGVVIEEIKMYEDVPDDLVHDLFVEAMWRGHALGRPIVGSEETVSSLTAAQMREYMAGHYHPEHLVVAAAGHLRHGQVVDLVSQAFAPMLTAAPSRPREWPAGPVDPATSRAVLKEKETEQVHLVVGVKGLPNEHPEIYPLHLLNTVLGGSTSSRLFQEIREERGLAYSVYSYQSSFRDAGNFAVYAGVSTDAVTEVMDLIMDQLHTVGEEGIPVEELTEAKEQLKGQIMLGLESTSGRMNRLGRGELSLGRVLSPDEIMSRVDAVTPEQVKALAGRLLLREPFTLAAVGPDLTQVDWRRWGFTEVDCLDA